MLRFQFVAQQVKLLGITLVSILLVVAVSISVNISTSNYTELKAEASALSSPEAMLLLDFQPNTQLKTLVNKIQSVTKLNNLSVTNLSSQLDFDGQTQTFTKSNDENKNSQDFINDFKKSQNAFLKTLVNFKTTNNPEKSVADSLLKKYSVETLKKTEKKYKSQDVSVSAISLGGSLQNMEKLNDIAKNNLRAKTSILIDFALIKANALETKIKVDAESTQEGKIKFANKGLNDYLERQSVNNPDFKRKLTETASEVISNDSKSISLTINSKTYKSAEANENTPVEKILSFVDGFGVIKTTAANWDWTNGWNYRVSSWNSANYWGVGNGGIGVQFWVSKPVIDAVSDWGTGTVGAYAGSQFGRLCVFSGPAAFFCAALVGIATYYMVTTFSNYLKSACPNSGSALDIYRYPNSSLYIHYLPYCSY
jgi:hypothetical protein